MKNRTQFEWQRTKNPDRNRFRWNVIHGHPSKLSTILIGHLFQVKQFGFIALVKRKKHRVNAHTKQKKQIAIDFLVNAVIIYLMSVDLLAVIPMVLANAGKSSIDHTLKCVTQINDNNSSRSAHQETKVEYRLGGGNFLASFLPLLQR